MSKVYIVGISFSYQEMFTSKGWEVVDELKDADLVQFTGGSDVSPAYYGEVAHPTTGYSVVRDAQELAIYQVCRALGIPMTGICRGGQFLHVMNGGSMWQDVKGHAIFGTHSAVDIDTEVELLVSSTHHQMMRDNDAGKLVLLGTHNPCDVKSHMDDYGEVENVECDVDVEAVYYEDTKCFCFQPHPEFGGVEQCRNYYFLKLKEFFGLE